MKLIVSNVSGVPIYEQIKRQVKSAILSGELWEEEALPSLRTIAEDLTISVLTATRAYAESEEEGSVKNIQGRDCYVMGCSSELIREHLIRIEPAPSIALWYLQIRKVQIKIFLLQVCICAASTDLSSF